MEKYLGPLYTFISYFWDFNTKNKSKNKDLWYFDFETTGLNPYHDKIIEYSFILEEGEDYDLTKKNVEKGENKLDEHYYINELVNPETKFERKISEITGILPEDVDNKKPINYHIDIIDEFINNKEDNTDTYLVAHNCDAFDKLFLINNFKNNKNINYQDWKYIDTLHLAKKLLPNQRSFSLKSLSKYFNIQSGSHRALSDTVCLRNLYHKLMEILSNEITTSKQYLLDNPNIVYDYIY
jgi:DNA polymerase III alpha subunit (gram-positive type)